ncbi:probable mitotic spindle assembly checkpoint protein MAD2 [Cyanidioschyzon merolae strain 10D]|jgi:mitotic spindle assembly checkpoint protein MAD2|uniref:Probable mitotic spindle assembly checkpoint protein MAD2 n=1 Tax=Cyanidioschyzon merolae (strain NIES-3377 / 10D) TaxID=280699 RepID=M1VM30_CYAM1|nr:probable mitotic spindle assembly checkpoint protein MAD2 [Cyanidioschyzon merolae strain 10D]BAM82928.1 probable mitotic spindle assembly checkpoint protein MAD2 [Cyanidioschyzon merolae strain 10D]|eukprot:XP_005538964.1 probable mitotic spindle assembly checkpoint protein MAD2 [Cyanidioschyzon merolae strain 10D]
MATAGSEQAPISLRGSTDTVIEFLRCAIYSILYQRGIYPPEMFRRASKFGTSVLVAQEAQLDSYIERILQRHLRLWVLRGSVHRVVLAFAATADPGRILERWHFDLHMEQRATEDSSVPRDESVVMREIQAIIRQITASVTFLPLLDEPCSFDLLVYTDPALEADANEWEESDAKLITAPRCEQVKLRSFTTNVHRVETGVAYACKELTDTSYPFRKPILPQTFHVATALA